MQVAVESFRLSFGNRIRNLAVDDPVNVIRQQIPSSTLCPFDGVADDVHHWLHGQPCSIREAADLVDCDALKAFGLAE